MDVDNSAEDRRIAELTEYLRLLGLDTLAHEISEERFARRIYEAQQIQQKYDFQEHIEHQLQDTIEQRLIAMHGTLFDKSAAYNNIIISFGYAGFFAIWGFINDQLHPWDAALVAVLLGLSLILFVYWTLKISLHNAFSARLMGNALVGDYQTKEEKVEAILAAENRSVEKAIIIQGQWFPVFLVTVILGFGAGVLLLILVLFQVLNIEFSYHDFVFMTLANLIESRGNSL